MLGYIDELYCIIINMIKKRELVIKILKDNTEGLTVIEIAKKLHISRNTVAVVLAELKGANLIRIRPVGMAKLHYLRKGGKK
ncbi:MAG: HTH domain-containing protein [Bacteroidetes bacterium]|nr:HTH domain-containing protein [Bacteroidota bacterium]